MLTKREEIMGRKIARPVLPLLCFLLAGCAGGQTVGSTQGTEDVVKGTIVTAYIQQPYGKEGRHPAFTKIPD